MIRPLTKHLFDCLVLDVWPRASAICDFGIDSSIHYGALQHAVKHDGVTAEELDSALGDGKKLTELVRKHVGNPYGNPTFKTAYDDMDEEE
jgi:hypothetical protein